MAVGPLIISEISFFLVIKFGKVPIDHPKKVICDFYDVNDIRTAKSRLRAASESVGS